MLTSESYGYSCFEHWKNDYSYDNHGNRTSQTKTVYGYEVEKSVSYNYDLNNRLTSTSTDNLYEDDYTTAYTYDANGNALTETSNGITKSYGYDNRSRVITN